MRTFSSAVALGRILVIWYDRAIPFCEIRLGGSPVISSPLNRIRPEDGCRTPVRQLKNVLLPAPLGPMTARISSRRTAKSTWFSAVKPPNRTVSASVRRIGSSPSPRGRLSSDAPPAKGSTVTDPCPFKQPLYDRRPGESRDPPCRPSIRERMGPSLCRDPNLLVTP